MAACTRGRGAAEALVRVEVRLGERHAGQPAVGIDDGVSRCGGISTCGRDGGDAAVGEHDVDERRLVDDAGIGDARDGRHA